MTLLGIIPEGIAFIIIGNLLDVGTQGMVNTIRNVIPGTWLSVLVTAIGTSQ